MVDNFDLDLQNRQERWESASYGWDPIPEDPVLAQPPMDNPKESINTWGFGPFKIKGLYVAFLGCLLNEIGAFFSFWLPVGFHAQNLIFGIYLINAAMYLLIIVAQKKRRPSYYLPYFGFMANGLILTALACLLLTALIIVAPQYMIDEFNKEYPKYKMSVKNFRLRLGLTALAYGLSIALNGWFYSLIYRAYKCMKSNNGQGGGDAAGQIPLDYFDAPRVI